MSKVSQFSTWLGLGLGLGLGLEPVLHPALAARHAQPLGAPRARRRALAREARAAALLTVAVLRHARALLERAWSGLGYGLAFGFGVGVRPALPPRGNGDAATAAAPPCGPSLSSLPSSPRLKAHGRAPRTHEGPPEPPGGPGRRRAAGRWQGTRGGFGRGGVRPSVCAPLSATISRSEKPIR